MKEVIYKYLSNIKYSIIFLREAFIQKVKQIYSFFRAISVVVYIIIYVISVFIFAQVYNCYFRQNTTSFIITTEELNRQIDSNEIMGEIRKKWSMEQMSPDEWFNLFSDPIFSNIPLSITAFNNILKEYNEMEEERARKKWRYINTSDKYKTLIEDESVLREKLKIELEKKVIPDTLIHKTNQLLEAIDTNCDDFYKSHNAEIIKEIYTYILSFNDWGKFNFLTDEYRATLDSILLIVDDNPFSSIDSKYITFSQKNDTLFSSIKQTVSPYIYDNVFIVDDLKSNLDNQYLIYYTRYKNRCVCVTSLIEHIYSIDKLIKIFNDKRRKMLNYSDFLYFSFFTSISSNFGYLIPNDRQINGIISLQIIISLILLGLIVARLVDILKEKK